MEKKEITDNDAMEKEHLALVLRTSELLGSSLDIQQILDCLMDQVIEVIKAERGFVMMRDEVGEEWQFRSARAIEQGALMRDDFRISKSIVEKVAQEGISVLTSDAMRDKRFQGQASISLYDLKSILCVPLIIQGRILGVIYADNRMETAVFDKKDKILLESIARQAAIALENARLYNKLMRVHEESMEQARKELAQTQAQLFQSSKMAAVGQLAAGIAHEINNPLGAIALNISSIRKEIIDDRVQKRLEIVEKATAKCKDIVVKLLCFSHPSGNDSQDVNLADLISSTISLVEIQFNREKIEIFKSFEGSLVISGNLGEFSQVVMNILMNARDALKKLPAEMKRIITIKTFKNSMNNVIEINDNGEGIPDDIRERIFEPFFTTKGIGEGVGLGLSISFQIVKKYRGEINVVSQPGRGTTFTLIFPAVR